MGPQRSSGPSRHSRGGCCQAGPRCCWRTCQPSGLAGYPYAAAYPYAVGVPGALVAHPNGAVVPADTAEVYAAKVAHAAAGGVVNPVGYYGLPYAYAGLVAHPNGAVVPVEPADVQA